jgi:hypothetical protein
MAAALSGATRSEPSEADPTQKEGAEGRKGEEVEETAAPPRSASGPSHTLAGCAFAGEMAPACLLLFPLRLPRRLPARSSASQELPQDVLQDPPVTVIVRLVGGVDPRPDLERMAAASVGPGRHAEYLTG